MEARRQGVREKRLIGGEMKDGEVGGFCGEEPAAARRR